MAIMSTDLVVFEQNFPAHPWQKPMVPAPSPGRSGMLPAAPPAVVYTEAARTGWIVVERQAGSYGPDARIISELSPGLIVDFYA